MMNSIWSSVILLFCVAFIMLDHCSVLAMKPGFGRKNAVPSIPQQQEQQQDQEEPIGVPPITDVLTYLAANKKKSAPPSSAGASSTKPEGASSRSENPEIKPEEHNREQGDQNCNNQSQRATRFNPHWRCQIDLEPEIERGIFAPKGAHKKIPAKFLPPFNKGNQGKSKDSGKPSGSAAKSKSKKKTEGKHAELPTKDEELSGSVVSKIKLRSEGEDVKVGGKEKIAQVQEEPLEAAAGDEMVKSERDE